MAGIERDIIDAVLEDHHTAPIDPSLRETLTLLQTFTLHPERLGPKDFEPLLATGLTPPAIREAMYVAFVFNVIDRLADAFDFAVFDAEHQRRTAKLLQVMGYWSAAMPV